MRTKTKPKDDAGDGDGTPDKLVQQRLLRKDIPSDVDASGFSNIFGKFLKESPVDDGLRDDAMEADDMGSQPYLASCWRSLVMMELRMELLQGPW